MGKYRPSAAVQMNVPWNLASWQFRYQAIVCADVIIFCDGSTVVRYGADQWHVTKKGKQSKLFLDGIRKELEALLDVSDD